MPKGVSTKVQHRCVFSTSIVFGVNLGPSQKQRRNEVGVALNSGLVQRRLTAGIQLLDVQPAARLECSGGWQQRSQVRGGRKRTWGWEMCTLRISSKELPGKAELDRIYHWS